MATSRPGSGAVTFAAVLHFVVGGFGVLYTLCGGFGVAQLLTAPELLADAQPTDAGQYLSRNVPGYVAVKVGDVTAGAVFAALLITAGVGLLMSKPWARYASLAYGLLGILINGGLLLYQILVISPAWEEFLEQTRRGNDPRFGGVIQGFGNAYWWVGITTYAVCLAYPVLVTLLMLLPGVAAYFQAVPDPDRARRRRREPERDYDDDFRNRDYDVRRRRFRREDDYDR